ncbi:olfactory receptor 8D1-like [Pseudophryne corroboree]|uniref:olfactory receptor 8D1-like n=1 Tax=Pseudophryne corroboree TaxID=495146 RepID=UPI003081EDFB
MATHPNQTDVKYFIINGISDEPKLQFTIFLLVLLIYLITLCANLTILLACRDPILHTPMYFFLGNLSIVDICSSTVTLHKILINFITGNNIASFFACMAQMYSFGSFQGIELWLLTFMSYDRYVAICKPLHYHMVMNIRTCAIMVSVCWVLGFMQILPPVVIVFNFSCYLSNEVDHFFCDIVPLVKISCDDKSFLEMLLFVEALFPTMFTQSVLTFIPYVFIIVAIVKIRSGFGRRKAFYTCSSHLMVVVLLYSTLFSQYLTPNVSSTLHVTKMYALFNAAAVPMLNPLIYSLKNKDVKKVLKKGLRKLEVN